MLQRKSVRAEFKADGKPGEFTALFSVFDNLDRHGDIIRKGAFVPAFAAEPHPPVVWTHLWDVPPIGETLDADETKNGARGHGKLFIDEHPVAVQVYAGMKSGALKQFSFAYDIADGGFLLRETVDDEKSPRWDGMIRELTALSDVFEWGPTLVGANPETTLLDGPKSIETLLGVSAKDLRAALGIDQGDRLEELVNELRSELKSGARNSTKDAARLQQIHDLAVENGASCSADDEEEDDDDDVDADKAFDLLFGGPSHSPTHRR